MPVMGPHPRVGPGMRVRFCAISPAHRRSHAGTGAAPGIEAALRCKCPLVRRPRDARGKGEERRMCCRRCGYTRPIKLEKRLEEDNDVFRCGECGYIFSPVSRREEPAGARPSSLCG